MDAERIINGTYGELHENGVWMENINNVTADLNIKKNALQLSGGIWDKHKVVGVSGSGTISGYKVTSAMIQSVSWAQTNRGVPTSTELISWLKDPEAYGFEAVRLKNVKWDKVTLVGWTAGQEVREDTPFTFEGYELINPINAV